MVLSKFVLEWLIAFMMVEISAYTTNIVLSTCQLIYTFFHYFFLRYWFIRTNLNNEIPTIKATCNASFNFIPRIKLKYEIFDRIYYFSEKSIYIYIYLVHFPQREIFKKYRPKPLENFFFPRRGPNFLLENTGIENSYPRKRFLSEDSSSALPSKATAIAPLVY